ncbi:MAG: hypothetical protein SFU99_01575 [Saprospiraceae bacterium]|nr:hypothetical protein [Saprospiraceae bacterium]
MTVERTADEIIIRLPSSMDIEGIMEFLSYLQFKEITQKSQATQEDADRLAKEANKNWWERNKDKYLPGA